MTHDQQRNDLADNEENILTNRQGHLISDNQNMRTLGERGPTVLENYNFLEKITHFDREHIPERVVHVRGAGVQTTADSSTTAALRTVSNYPTLVLTMTNATN